MADKKTKQNKKSFVLPVLAAAVAIIALLVLIRPGGKKQAEADRNQPLSIPKLQITETASFYPVTVEGTQMEVLAIRTASGEIRTAFNTCESCYASGRGYYVADGKELVCQNCGFRYKAEDVGLEGNGGCNPWPIPASERTETDDAIEIPWDTLVGAKEIFARWGKG